MGMVEHHLNPLTNMTLAYTDGACRGNPGQGGYGAVVILPSGERREICGGEPLTTNNQMELMGVIMALQHSPADIPIQIWSDSNYVIQGITQWIHGWKTKNWKSVKNVELWQQLDALTKNRTIDWQWLKGHAGHIGNEYADKLANQGIDNLTYTQFTINSFPPPMMNEMSNQTQTLTDIEQLFFYPENPPEMDDYIPPDDWQGEFIDHNLAMSNHLPPLEKQINVDNFVTDFQPMRENVADDLIINEQKTAQSPDLSPKEKAKQTAMILASFPQFVDNQGIFVGQDDYLQQQRPAFDGITNQPNQTFVPLLPIAKNAKRDNRQLILDTETTGFDYQGKDRIIEIGIVELIDRKFTGEKLHVYINPHLEMTEEVLKVHGIYNSFLAGMPDFTQVGQVVFDFLAGAELIAHNASFDMGFLQAEFARLGLDIQSAVTVTDSLAIAKQMYPAQKNSLDALVKRLDVGKKDRTFHGALLDAEILAEVYLAMTGGQVSLVFDDEIQVGGKIEHLRFNSPVQRFFASESSENAHLNWLNALKAKNPQLAKNWGLVTENEG